MESTLTLADVPDRSLLFAPHGRDEHSSGVSWGAVIGGAFVTASISLIMLALGAGFGLSVVSPWSSVGASAAAMGGAAIAWLILNEIVSCSLGGYLAGRLRTKWVTIHNDEVYFRDTANGFLVWAVSVVMTVAFLASAASFMAGTREAAATGGVSSKSLTDPNAYFVDKLFRSSLPAAQPIDAVVQAETGRILVNTLRHSQSSGTDEQYLATLVASRTGLNQSEAQNRVSQVISDAWQTEDTARRAASRLLLWIFLALLIGAFSASYAATIGGRQRDHVKVI